MFEYNVEGNHVMRRRSDHFINATHILKVAEYDKPARTRILEREVQKNPKHQKIQGGYGKYQGQLWRLPMSGPNAEDGLQELGYLWMTADYSQSVMAF